MPLSDKEKAIFIDVAGLYIFSMPSGLRSCLRDSFFILTILMLFSDLSFSKDRAVPPPTDFVVGQLTFFDFGPPFTFYDIFIVHGEGDRSVIKKIALTPKGAMCMQPPKVELVSGAIPDPVTALWAGKYPARFQTKKLRGSNEKKERTRLQRR